MSAKLSAKHPARKTPKPPTRKALGLDSTQSIKVLKDGIVYADLSNLPRSDRLASGRPLLEFHNARQEDVKRWPHMFLMGGSEYRSTRRARPNDRAKLDRAECDARERGRCPIKVDEIVYVVDRPEVRARVVSPLRDAAPGYLTILEQGTNGERRHVKASDCRVEHPECEKDAIEMQERIRWIVSGLVTFDLQRPGGPINLYHTVPLHVKTRWARKVCDYVMLVNYVTGCGKYGSQASRTRPNIPVAGITGLRWNVDRAWPKICTCNKKAHVEPSRSRFRLHEDPCGKAFHALRQKARFCPECQ